MGFDSIGKKIKDKRESKGLRQEDLAELTNLSVNYISKIERGERMPGLKNFVIILNKLGASADEILSEVLDNGYMTRTSLYAEKIGKLAKEEQKRIFAIIEAYLEGK